MKIMSKIYLVVLITVFTTGQAVSQRIGNLNGINYQAVAIDEEGKEIVGMDIMGKPLYEKQIGVRFTIHKGESGPVQYQETHTALTDEYGLFSLIIGKGAQTGSGTYPDLLSIPWIDADQWLKVEIAVRNDGNYRMVSLQQFMSVPYSFYTDDIADNAITTEKILNETILEEDIATGAVTTSEILNGTILNEDISDGTINLKTKVTDTLAVKNGGTGSGYLEAGGLLIGGGSDPVKALPQGTDGQIPVGITSSDPVMKVLTGGSGILVTQKADSVIVSSTITGGVQANGVEAINIGIISSGSTYISQSFPVPGGNALMGDIILASINVNLNGCMLTPYLFSDNTARIAIYNGTPAAVNLGNNVQVKILIVK